MRAALAASPARDRNRRCVFIRRLLRILRGVLSLILRGKLHRKKRSRSKASDQQPSLAHDDYSLPGAT
jgi:hypothetical protein